MYFRIFPASQHALSEKMNLVRTEVPILKMSYQQYCVVNIKEGLVGMRNREARFTF